MSNVPPLGMDAEKASIRLLYLTPEPWPTFRADIRILFGKYLPKLGIFSDLVTQQNSLDPQFPEEWGGGRLISWSPLRSRALHQAMKLVRSVLTVLSTDRENHSAVQVRDMPVHAFIVLLIARSKGIPFYYWMSFPKHDGQLISARTRGIRAGIRFWIPMIQGTIGRFILLRIVLPRADHVFVQSPKMQDELCEVGIARERLTPVPMGVDLDQATPAQIRPIADSRLDGSNVLVYLGTLNPSRQVDKLFEMLALVLASEPAALLVLVGDSDVDEHRTWLHSEAERWGVADSVVWTGWVSTPVAWSYVRAAKVGLSPFPRGELLDSASPTKAVEYLALGVPVVVNDNPDQEELVRKSGAGICVEYLPEKFAAAVLKLLRDDALREDMADRGRQYVGVTRDYRFISNVLADKYRELLDRKL